MKTAKPDSHSGIPPNRLPACHPVCRWSRRVFLLLTTVLALQLCGLALAQNSSLPVKTPMGAWGDVKRLEFTGLNTFTTNAVIKGLLQSPEFLLAAHPAAPLEEYPTVLVNQTRTGYRHAGFRDVQVNAVLDEARQRVKVTIHEGTCFRAGNVRFENAGQLPVAQLIQSLTTTLKPAGPPPTKPEEIVMPKKEPAPWETGEPVGFDKAALRAVETAVRESLGRAGYLYCTFKTRMEEEPGKNRVTLVIEIEKTGEPAKLGAVEITGLKKHTSEELIRWLDIKSGQPVTIDFVPDLKRKMEDSGRFLQVEITPAEAPHPDGGLDLKIAVKEYRDAPKVNDHLSRGHQAALRTSRWIEDSFQAGMEFAFESDFRDYKFDGMNKGMSGKLELILRQDAIAVAWRQETKLIRGLLVTTNGILYACPATNRKLKFQTQRGFSVQAAFGVVPNPEAEEEATPFSTTFSFGFLAAGLAGKSPVEILFRLSPGVMLHEMHAAGDKVKFTGDELLLSNTNRSWRIHAATGALIEAHTNQAEEKEAMISRLRPAAGAIARIEKELASVSVPLSDQLRPKQPLASMLALTVAEYAEAPLAGQILTNLPFAQHLPAAASTIQRFLLSGILDPFEPSAEAQDGNRTYFVVPDESEFSTVQNATQRLWSYAAALTFRFSQEYLPPQSWPATLAREGVMLMMGKPKYAEPELTRIASSPDTGPIGCLAAAHLLAFAGNAEAASQFANIGLTRLDQPHFEKDAALLLEIADRILANSSEKLQPITSITPQEMQAMAALMPSAFGRLFQSAVAALKLKPGQGTRQTLMPILTDAWNAGLKNEIAGRLKQASSAANKRQEADRLFALALALHTGSEGTTDLPRAIALYEESFKLGNAGAAYQLGTLYHSGQGLELDIAKAVKHYSIAADQGLVIAQVKLAEMYMLGLDVPKDLQSALLWYRVAELGGAEGARAMANTITRQLPPEQVAAVMQRIQQTLSRQSTPTP